MPTNAFAQTRETVSADRASVELPRARDTSEPPGRFFAFRFSGHRPAEAGTFVTRLPILHGDLSEEQWLDRGAIVTGTEGRIRYVASDTHLVVHLEIRPEALLSVERTVDDAYRSLLDVIEKKQYPHPVRAWNFIPDINRGEGDDERYRLFSSGRAAAFDASAITEARLPAGTAIGVAAEQPLTVTLLAARAPPRMISNARQLDAYHYPREYGPRSPSFSRAALIEGPTTQCLLVSGTASVVGHASLHPGDAARQTEETCVNLLQLMNDSGCGTDPDAHAGATFRVYIRNPAYLPEVRTIHERFFPRSRTFYLQGDICRRDLLVEIEATLTWPT